MSRLPGTGPRVTSRGLAAVRGLLALGHWQSASAWSRRGSKAVPLAHLRLRMAPGSWWTCLLLFSSQVFICGPSPHWLLVTSRGALRLHPMTLDGPIESFAPFHNVNCPKGFLYFNRQVRLAWSSCGLFLWPPLPPPPPRLPRRVVSLSGQAGGRIPQQQRLPFCACRGSCGSASCRPTFRTTPPGPSGRFRYAAPPTTWPTTSSPR